MLETALNEALTEHLGHDRHRRADPVTGNIRNGTRPKTALTRSSGEVQLEVPRDQAGTLEPQIVRKRQRRLTGVDQIVVSLYANGLTCVRRMRRRRAMPPRCQSLLICPFDAAAASAICLVRSAGLAAHCDWPP